jgi:squalene-associated FAD-dependent desaturase
MNILIIGGGLSGLSCAVNLASPNNKITIIEASPKLGGKAYSFYSKRLNAEIDNGQHLMLGCYVETFKYLEKINSLHNIELIDGIQIPFVTKKSGIFYLKSTSNIYPINLIWAFLKFKYLKFPDKFKIAKLFFEILLFKNKSSENAHEFLIRSGQEELLSKFWEPILISIFNCDLNQISSSNLVKILKQIFLTGANSYRFAIPKVSLSELFINNAVSLLENNNVDIKISERVIKINTDNDKVTEVITTKEKYTGFDYVVFAIPPYSLTKLLNINELEEIEYNPIISVHLKINPNLFNEKYCTIPNSFIQWIFRKGDLLSLVTSNPGRLVELNEEELINLYLDELVKYFPQITKNDIIEYVIIKEKRATFILNEQIETIRKKNVLLFSNIIVAGDWTNTGLPSTIESAILSGKKAAEEIISK